MAGRRPKPTAQKRLQGNPGKRPLPAKEPKPSVGLPPCPTDALVSGTARRAYIRLGAVVDGMGISTEADGLAMELLADVYAEYRAARDIVEELGSTYETMTESGSVMVRARPEVAIASDAWRRCTAMAKEFGLTPAARTKVEKITNEEDDFDALLGKKPR
jgi:P27 family predicted phage terminase small subunit